MSTPILPIIHLNGDKPETLMAALRNAHAALNIAHAAMQETAPNGRNYYPVRGLLREAQAQYQRRMQTITALQEELLAAYQGIEAQQRMP